MKRQFLQLSRRQSLRRSLFSLALLFGIIGSSVLMFSSGVFANDLTYQTSVPVEFTFNDYLNIAVSGDLVISDLAPGTFADSNHIAVTVNTNNAYGYTLSATVGDTNNASRDLRHSGYGTGGNTEVFSNLDLDANLTRETFSTGSTYDNKWGFSTDKLNSVYSGKYNGLPLYTNTEDAVVLDTSNYMPTNGTSTTNFWIGAKAPSDKVAGTYTNVVNFMVVGGEAPMGLAESYAAASKTKQNGYYRIQDMTSDICNTVEVIGSQLQVIDTRDESIYWIGKLADGKCWMLDNLALDLTNPTVLNGINESNTHASNTTLGYLKGTTSRNPSTDANGNYATAGVANWTSSYSYSAPLVNISNKDVVPTSYNGTDDPMKDKVVAGNWKVGGYYNYCAASAGSYCYGNGTSVGTSSDNATEDICPKGWRLPTGNTSGEYPALANAIYGSTGSTSDATAYANYRSALRLPLSGYFNNGSASSQGSYGRWWSSTRYGSSSMYRLYANTSNISPANGDDRYYGSSVRCVQGP